MMTKKDNAGFTLVEVMIVVVIIAIMAAIGAPVISSIMPDIHVKDEARTLYRNMQGARMLAVKDNSNTAIQFDTVNRKYDICDDWNTTTTTCDVAIRTVQFVTLLTSPDYKSGVGYGYGEATTDVPLVAFPAIPDDDAQSAAYISYNNDRVVFNPQGMGNAGFVYLDHVNNDTTYAVGSATSGVIRLLRWNSGSGTWE